MSLAGRHQALVRQFVNAARGVDEVDATLEKRLVGLVAHGGKRDMFIHVWQQVVGLMRKGNGGRGEILAWVLKTDSTFLSLFSSPSPPSHAAVSNTWHM